MIKLLQVELHKIFHKKGIYIVWLLMLIFCFLNNFLYKTDYDEDGNYKYLTKENLIEEKIRLEKELENISLEEINFPKLAVLQSKIELISLKENYSPNTWQYQKINSYFYDLIYQIKLLSLNKQNLILKQELISLYHEEILKLNENNYKYFLEKEKNNLQLEQTKLNIQIKTVKDISVKEQLNNKMLELNSKIQVLEYRIKESIPEDNNYLNLALNNYLEYQSVIDDFNNLKRSKTYQEELVYKNNLKELMVNKYILETKQNINKQNTLNYQLRTIVEDYELFIILIILLVSTTIICEEFKSGTIKLLLIKPYSRVKILLGKYLTSILILFVTILLLIIFQLLIGGFIFGFTSLEIPVVIYNYSSTEITEIPIFNYMLIRIFAKLPFLLIFLTICFFFAIITTSTTLSLIIPLIFYLFSPSIYQLTVQHNLKWMRYFITLNWDFTDYLFGQFPKFSEMNLKFTIIIYSIYFLIIIFLTFIYFKNKNIKNI